MRKNLLFVAAFLMAFSLVNAQYSVLVVDDDANGSDESFRIDTALANSGYTYSFINIDTNAAPTYDDLKDYDMVIWTTSNDGENIHLWDVSDTTANGIGAIKFNAALTQYVDSGNVLWIDGLDYMYDIYGGAPYDFNAGDFCYDVMGIDNYAVQSKIGDTVYTGLPVAVKVAGNTINSLDSIKWKFSTVWYADGFDITTQATALYEMGPADYDYAGYTSAFYRENIITSSLRIGALGDANGNYIQADIDLLVKDMVDAANAGTFARIGMGVENTLANNVNVQVYPNPARDMITFAITASQNAILSVYDITGKVVFSQSVDATNGNYNLDLSNYNSGMYFYNLTLDNNSVTGKFSVVK